MALNRVRDPKCTATTRWLSANGALSVPSRLRINPTVGVTGAAYVYPISVGTATNRFPVSPGDLVAARCQVWGSYGLSARLSFVPYSGTSGVSGSVPGSYVPLDPFAFTVLESFATVPDGADGMLPILYIYRESGAFVSGDWADTDNWSLFTGASAPTESPVPFFSGDDVGAYWLGTANDSESAMPSIGATVISGGVRLAVDYPGQTTATVTRISEDGSIINVRNAEPLALDANGVGIAFDYEAPLDTDFYYVAEIPSGETTTSATVRLPSNGLTWLRHPGKPYLNRAITLARGPSLSRPIETGVFDVLGRSRPIAISTTRQSERGELEIVTLTETERADVANLIADGATLALAAPSGYGLPPVMYVAIGEAKEERVSGLGSEPARIWALGFTVVDRPAGAALAVGNSWLDLSSTYATWRTAQSGEGTWAGVLEGVG